MGRAALVRGDGGMWCWARATAGLQGRARPITVKVSQPVVEEVTEFEEFTGRIGAVRSVDIRAG